MRYLIAITMIGALTSIAQAQERVIAFPPQAVAPLVGAAPQAATPGIPVEAPRPAAPLRNVRFEILITDSGVARPTTKKVSMIVTTGRVGQVRSVASEAQGNPAFTRAVPLNVDIIRPFILDNGNVSVAIVIEYQPMSPGTVAVPATVKASLDAILPNGRKTLISETADPTSDRTTSLEVTATVLP